MLGVPEPGAEPVILKVHAAGGRWAVRADGERAAGGGRTVDGERTVDGGHADGSTDGSEHDDGTA